MRQQKYYFGWPSKIAVYVIGVSLTFGYITHYDRWLCTYGTNGRDPDFVGACAVSGSLAWPAYWTFRSGYLLFGNEN